MRAKEPTANPRLPRHVGIIMDGNGRWAKRLGAAHKVGHKRGAEAFGKIARHASSLGIEYLTVYAFSTENWSRPPEEVEDIMALLCAYLKDMARYEKENFRLNVLGEREPLDASLRDTIQDVERRSKANTGMVLNIALNYGGREEIVQAARRLALHCAQGGITPQDIDQNAFAECLYTAGQPNVDLIIRTSGEMRISNFLLWQSAYAEYVFCNELWPDFTPKHFDNALREYARRERRMGGR